MHGVCRDPVFIENQMRSLKCGKVLTGAVIVIDPRVKWLCLAERFARRDGVVQRAQISGIRMTTDQDWHCLIWVGWIAIAIVVEMDEDVPVLVGIHVQI